MTARIKIKKYQDEAGRVPFDEWFTRLRDLKARAQVLKRLNRVELGLLGDTKAVGEGVHELRLDVGPGYRVYYGRKGQTVILLLCGGSKSTQSRDIKTAKIYWRSLLRR